MSDVSQISPAAAAAPAAEDSPDAIVDVRRVLGEGAVFAALVQITSGGRTTRGTVVLTLDRDDRATSVRVYVDWPRSADAGPR